MNIDRIRLCIVHPGDFINEVCKNPRHNSQIFEVLSVTSVFDQENYKRIYIDRATLMFYNWIQRDFSHSCLVILNGAIYTMTFRGFNQGAEGGGGVKNGCP